VDATFLPGADVVTETATVEGVRHLLETVTDPEIPVLTIADIGILRDIECFDDGRVSVSITPTYSGCPAMEAIREDIVATLTDAGYVTEVTMVFDPAWTTDSMTDEGRRKLVGFGIAAPRSLLSVVDEVLCPQCGSSASREVAPFGSTACKRLMVCTSCGEPFDHFKEI
jgi:ring-1,2-phenylacetyl-CoA epoxidase subunit PaaD